MRYYGYTPLKRGTMVIGNVEEEQSPLTGLTFRLFLIPIIVGLVNACCAYTIKEFADQHMFYFETLEVHDALLRNSAVWSGFTTLVGFLVVFRVSQGYSRFWSAMTAAHLMSAEWNDACAQLVAYTRTSQAGDTEKWEFRQTIIRLFSMLHASALRDLMLNEQTNDQVFQLIVLDPSSLDSETRTLFVSSSDRTHLVLNWIHGLMVESASNGVIATPPPIVTRAFQEVKNGTIKYHDALKSKDVEFPTVYAWTCYALLLIHWLLMPWIVTTWVTHKESGAFFAFIVVFLMWSLLFIARSLERPFQSYRFWKDAHRLQANVNRRLALTISPSSLHGPSFDNSKQRPPYPITVQRIRLVEDPEDCTSSGGESDLEFQSWRTSSPRSSRTHFATTAEQQVGEHNFPSDTAAHHQSNDGNQIIPDDCHQFVRDVVSRTGPDELSAFDGVPSNNSRGDPRMATENSTATETAALSNGALRLNVAWTGTSRGSDGALPFVGLGTPSSSDGTLTLMQAPGAIAYTQQQWRPSYNSGSWRT